MTKGEYKKKTRHVKSVAGFITEHEIISLKKIIKISIFIFGEFE